MSIGRRWVWAVVAAAGLALGACGDDDDDNGGDGGDGGNGGNNTGVSTTGTFATQVYPILTAKCGACHASEFGSSTLQTAFDQAKTRVNTTTPAESTLLVAGNGGASHPGGDRLTDGETTTIQGWIQAGASGQ